MYQTGIVILYGYAKISQLCCVAIRSTSRTGRSRQKLLLSTGRRTYRLSILFLFVCFSYYFGYFGLLLDSKIPFLISMDVGIGDGCRNWAGFLKQIFFPSFGLLYLGYWQPSRESHNIPEENSLILVFLISFFCQTWCSNRNSVIEGREVILPCKASGFRGWESGSLGAAFQFIES